MTKRQSRHKGQGWRLFVFFIGSDQHAALVRDCSKRASALFQSMKENQ